jgi:hypothetical protein
MPCSVVLAVVLAAGFQPATDLCYVDRIAPPKYLLFRRYLG